MLLSRPPALGSHVLRLQPCRLLRSSHDVVLMRIACHESLTRAVRWPFASCFACGSRSQVRGKKTRTVVRLEDLPQGGIALEPTPLEEEEEPAPSYPTVILQAKRNMQKFDNCVLLTRVGGFYEMYFEHAQEYGPLLNLKVASKKTSAGPVPMVSLFIQVLLCATV